jgi:hypothetical protein
MPDTPQVYFYLAIRELIQAVEEYTVLNILDKEESVDAQVKVLEYAWAITKALDAASDLEMQVRIQSLMPEGSFQKLDSYSDLLANALATLRGQKLVQKEDPKYRKPKGLKVKRRFSPEAKAKRKDIAKKAAQARWARREDNEST